MTKNKILVLAAGLVLSSVSCGDSSDDEIDCAATGRCDDIPDSQIPASPCDGKITDHSGANHKKVAGRLGDPFAKLVLRAGTDCPLTFTAIMEKLRTTDAAGCNGDDGISTRVVSETAQAGGAMGYRAVTTRVCGGRDTEDLVFSLFGLRGGQTSLPAAVEVVAFDTVTGVFNYYETDGTKLNFFGNSKDLLAGADGEDRRCANCHTGGGLIMKELDTPWVHWEGHMDTPGAAALVSGNKDLGSKSSGAEFEGVVKSGNTKWNATKLKNFRDASTVSVQDLLRPLFCPVEVNLDNGADFASPVGGGPGGDELTRIPFDSMLDPNLKGFGGISVAFADYDSVIKANGQRITGITGAIDTVFDYVFLERAHADNNYVSQLKDAGIIDDDFIKDVVMVDFTRHLFSDDRCGLLSFAPQLTKANLTPAKIKAGFVTALEADSPTPGSPAGVLLANLKATGDAAAHDTKVNAFVAACTALGSRPFLVNALAIQSLNRKKARERPVMEFEQTMPTDNQSVNANARLHPTTCAVVNQFVAP